MKCEVCNENLDERLLDELPKCSACLQKFHFACSIKETSWRQYKASTTKQWKCSACRNPHLGETSSRGTPHLEPTLADIMTAILEIREKQENMDTRLSQMEQRQGNQILGIREKQEKMDTRLLQMEQRQGNQMLVISNDIKVIQERLAKQEEMFSRRMEALENTQRAHGENIRQIELQMDALVGRSMRENVVISGLEKSSDIESWEEVKQKVQALLVNHLGLHDIYVDRAHRARRPRPGETRPVDIVARIPRTMDRDAIWRNRKKLAGTNIYINEQFTKRVNLARYKLRPKLREAIERKKKARMVKDTLYIDDQAFIYDEIADEIQEVRRRDRSRTNPLT
jgi:hypothetical protein